MSKSTKAVSLTVGAAVALSLAAAPAFSASSNPFQMSSVKSNMLLAQADSKPKDAKCGGMKKDAESKPKDAKCGGMKKDAESKAGQKMKDGKCGEGTCGGKK